MVKQKIEDWRSDGKERIVLPRMAEKKQTASRKSSFKTPPNASTMRDSRKRYNIPPVGSLLGNKSCPQILQAATPVTMAAKAKNGP